MVAYRPPLLEEAVRAYRDSVRRFIEKEFAPHQALWRERHCAGPDAWLKAGCAGLLLPDVPEKYGGGGGNFAHEAVVIEELVRAGVLFGSGIQSIVAHYVLAYGSEEQKGKWLPRLARGELIAAIAMTEPGAGSDLQGLQTRARRQGEHYLVHGSKTFITNALHAGLVCLAARTDTRVPAMAGLSLIVVETKDLPGYRVGKPLEKLGMHAQDTCEISLDEVKVPVSNVLGAEGLGFPQMMEQLAYERLAIGVNAVASAELAVAATTRYVKERRLFGKPLMDLQNTRFKLAECASQARVGRVFLDSCIERFIDGRLDDATAAIAKYWLTEMQFRVLDECLQLHGGYGYMSETPVGRMWADGRVQRIYGGTNEIMKELIAWSL